MEPRYKMCELCLTTAVLVDSETPYCAGCMSDIGDEGEYTGTEAVDKFDWSTFDDLND